MFQATRRRLALWYTGVTAVLLLLFASGFYLYVRDTLVERVDDTLSHVVEVVQRSLVIEPANSTESGLPAHINLEASFRNTPEGVDDDRIDLEWFSSTGQLMWSTLVEPLDVPIHPNHRRETVAIAPDYWLRQLTEKLTIDGQVLGYLRVSHPWFEVTKPSHQLILDLCVGLTILVSFVAAIGWFLSGIAIEPIQQSYQQLKQFTADASHELRNPIALIQTNVQVALSDLDPDPQAQQKLLQSVERITQRLGRLVDDLLFLARQDSGMIELRLQAVPLDAVLMEVVEEQSAIAEAQGIQLTLELGDEETSTPFQAEPFTLMGDYDQLARLFTNLVSNGIQYTPANGRVHLSLQQYTQHNIPYLKVEVRDTGEGIPPVALPHLFDRFYRVDPARAKTPISGHPESLVQKSSMGTGLGLAIAQAISNNHQGQIRVKSQLNQGTTFTVVLPKTPTESPGQKGTLGSTHESCVL